MLPPPIFIHFMIEATLGDIGQCTPPISLTFFVCLVTLGDIGCWMIYPPFSNEFFVHYIIEVTLGGIGHWTRFDYDSGGFYLGG